MRSTAVATLVLVIGCAASPRPTPTPTPAPAPATVPAAPPPPAERPPTVFKGCMAGGLSTTSEIILCDGGMAFEIRGDATRAAARCCDAATLEAFQYGMPELEE